MQLKANRLAFKVALIYLSVAGGWILRDNKLMNLVISHQE